MPDSQPDPSPLHLSPETLAVCARQDIPAAHAGEWRAHVALIGERARRAAVEAEYAKYLQTPPTVEPEPAPEPAVDA